MIRLITGLPGHGKTLFAVAELLRERAQDDSRPLYVDGIKGLTVPHSTIDGRDWQSAQDGAIIVIDEAQRVFPTRSAGTPPEHVAELARHRHRGIDLWLITQHPGNIDSFVRERLIEEHIHVVRVMGSDSAMIYRWSEVQTDPRSISARELAITTPWMYPKAAYSAYSSAVMHTGKRRIPWRKVIVAGLVVFVPALLATAYALMPGTGEQDTGALPAASAASPTTTQSPPRELTPEQWLAQYEPRIPSRPESAPAYDKMMATAEPPKLLCIDVELAGCLCYTDQLTKWQGIPESQCKRIAKHGQFQLQVVGRRR